MLKKIKSFFTGEQEKTLVEQGKLWHCTKCKLIFLTSSAGKNHQCIETGVDHGKV